MITFLAPAARCLAASARAVKKPVDSITTSTPSSAQGRAAGIALGEHLDLAVPSTDDRPSLASTAPGKRPRIESYLSRWARVAGVGEVVDRDELEVGSRRVRGAEDVSPDAPEAVDADLHCH